MEKGTIYIGFNVNGFFMRKKKRREVVRVHVHMRKVMIKKSWSMRRVGCILRRDVSGLVMGSCFRRMVRC